MPKTKDTLRDDRLHVPTKADILDALRHDPTSIKFPAEQMLGKDDKGERAS